MTDVTVVTNCRFVFIKGEKSPFQPYRGPVQFELVI
jgi:hypothetical protein